MTGHTVYPRPVQRPHPPIVIGGNGPRLLALAAAEADVVGLSGITFRRGGTEPDLTAFRAAAVDERVRHLREAAGVRFERLELSALVQRVIVTDDRRAGAEELARRWPALGVDDILDSPFLLLGTLDEIAGQLVARRARWGISSYVIFAPALDAFASIVARLAGR